MNDLPTGATPALRRLELAAALRLHRKSARLTTAEVLTAVGFSASKLSRIETGNRPIQIADLKALCALYGLSSAEASRLAQLADESRQSSAWANFDAIDQEYFELEQGAEFIQDYKTSIVTTLLQVPDYMRALIPTFSPGLPADLVEDQVNARILRQKGTVSRDRATQLSFVLDEATLHRTVGGRTVMKAQLGHLLELMDELRLDIRVIPFDRGAHRGMDSLFTILSFREAIRDRVYIDSLGGPEYRIGADEIQRYRATYAGLQRLASNPEESYLLIKRLIGTI